MKIIVHFLKEFKNHYIYIGKKKVRSFHDIIYYKNKSFHIPKDYQGYIIRKKNIEIFFNYENALPLSFKEIGNFSSDYLDVFTSRKILKNLIASLESSSWLQLIPIILGFLIGLGFGISIGIAIYPNVIKSKLIWYFYIFLLK
jgi:hypothetical protein